MFLRNKNKGFAVFFIIVLVLVITLGIVLTISILAFNESRISTNIIESTQAYYTSESGIEDVLLRLKTDPGLPASLYSLNVGNSVATIDVSESIGGSRTITSDGNNNNKIRKNRVVYAITADEVSFFYGAQVDEGGIEMGNNARIEGSLFSNGDVIASSGVGYIDNDVVVAGNGNRIFGLNVGGNVSAYSCTDSVIAGDLTYVSGGSIVNCSAGGSVTSQPNEIEDQALPISQAQINEWKSDALIGGIIYTDLSYDGTSSSLGPMQVGTSADPKNLRIENGAVLTITGTIHVTGDIILNNNASLVLSSSYGSLSGITIADGTIELDNNSTLNGSGQTGSYVLILSTSDSLDVGDPAIFVGNNARGAIFYATSGLIRLSNNISAREVTGYKIIINNNAEIEYESGLADTLFSSGPGGSWQIESWNEIE